MADPTGGIGKASSQMMQEMQKQMQQVQEQNGPQKAGFNDVMAQQGASDPSKIQELQKLQDVNKVQQTPAAADVLRTAQTQQVNGVDPSLDVKRVEAPTKSESGLKAMLNQVFEGQGKLDQIIKLATSGKTYGNQELAPSLSSSRALVAQQETALLPGGGCLSLCPWQRGTFASGC